MQKGLIKKIKENFLSIYRHYVRDIEIDTNILCPFPDHNDQKTKSFHLYPDGGFKCFGCDRNGDCIDFVKFMENIPTDKEAITRAAEILGLEPNKTKNTKTIFTLDEIKNWQQGEYTFSRIHFYNAANPKYVKVILKNKDGDKIATFFTEMPKGYVVGKHSKPVLYNQEELTQRPTDYLCYAEGEKDVDTLKDIGFLAVTAGGVSEWKPYYKQWKGEHFKDRDVVIFPDFDEPGKKLAIQIANDIFKSAKSVRIVDIEKVFKTYAQTNPLPKQDISDFVELLKNQGKSLPEIRDIFSKIIVFDTQLVTEAQKSSPTGFSPEGSYFVDSEGYWCLDNGPNKQPRRLANFVAKIEKVITMDDGENEERIHVLVGTTNKGKELKKLQIPSNKFLKMDWISEWSPDAWLLPGQSVKDIVRHAIEVCSENYPEEKIFTHTGWRLINGNWVYLHAEGAIGGENILTKPQKGLENYVLPPTVKNVKNAIDTALKFLDIGKPEITYPLFAYIFLTPLTTLVDPPRFSLYLYGPTGSLKTTTAVLALNFFGKFNYCGHSSFADTLNALELKSFLLKDSLHLLDDLSPATQRTQQNHSENIAQYLIRAYSNRFGRRRMTYDLKARNGYNPRGMLIITGEDTIKIQSTQARLLTLEFDRDSIDKEKMSFMYKNTDLLRETMVGYLLFIRDKIDKLQEELDHYIELARVKLSSKNLAHPHLLDIYGYLKFGYSQFLQFALKHRAITKEQAEELETKFNEYFLKVFKIQSSAVDKEDPALMFVEILSSLLAQEKIRVEPYQYKDPRTHKFYIEDKPNKAELIGFFDDKYYYLIANVTYHIVQRFMHNEGKTFPVSASALHKMLAAKGFIEVQQNGENTKPMRVLGQICRVLVVKKSVLDPSEDEEALQDDNNGIFKLIQ
jgi:5S rRNA maturation endonuclease (ribonuclease M5)